MGPSAHFYTEWMKARFFKRDPQGVAMLKFLCNLPGKAKPKGVAMLKFPRNLPGEAKPKALVLTQ